jgi:hypothetical protein
LKRFRFNGKEGGYGHFAFAVTCLGNDLNTQTVDGKGAVDCTLDPPSIAVWSIE